MIHVITGLSASLLKKPSSRSFNETMFITYVNAPKLLMFNSQTMFKFTGMTIFSPLIIKPINCFLWVEQPNWITLAMFQMSLNITIK